MGTAAEVAFGTERDIDHVGYEYLVHSARPVEPRMSRSGYESVGFDCTRPYGTALMNVSAMSFGALSGNALRALNNGARKGLFAHDTGEGGSDSLSSRWRRRGVGDRLRLLRCSYQGRRVRSGSVRGQGAAHDLVKCVSIKLSQGAKPSASVECFPPRRSARRSPATEGCVPVGEKCVSRSSHSAFHTPRQADHVRGEAARAGRRKPGGFGAVCRIPGGRALAVCKAMLAGRGDARLHHRRWCRRAESAAAGAAGIRRQHWPPAHRRVDDRPQRVGGNGSAGPDTDRGGRQSRVRKRHHQAPDPRCGLHQLGPIHDDGGGLHPISVDVTPITARRGRNPDPYRARALDVADKSERVYRYQRATVAQAMRMIASMGVSDPSMLNTHMLRKRVSPTSQRSYAEIYEWLESRENYCNHAPGTWRSDWEVADPDLVQSQSAVARESQAKCQRPW